MVFYRKYRPQTIDELDSEKARKTLQSVLASKEIPHAFLFTGPKGLGKTSTARIIAKVVNCTKRKEGSYNPCNSCDACVSITNGSNVDVLEIDGASNRGIDEIRDLREKVKFAPSSLKKKIYIIDEVHMLTTEAFNALLKTIEEPPEHVMFLFCTTEPQKVPATILSRCFHLNFTRATDDEIVHSLKRIVSGEKIQVAEDALLAIAQMADGGFRDAAKMLEEISLLAAGETVTKEFVEKELRITNYKLQVQELLEQLQKKDTKKSLNIVSKVVEQGIDIKYFLQQVIATLHAFLLQKAGVEKEVPIIKYQSSIDEIMQLISLLSKAYTDTKFAVIPQLPLEIAIIQWCQTQENAERIVEEAVTVASSSGKPTMQSLQREAQVLKVQSILNPQKEEPKKVVDNNHEQRSIPAKRDDNAAVLENLIYKVKPLNHSLAALLRGCKVISFDATKLVLEAGYKFHKERIEERKSKEILEKVIKEITGKETQITVELKK